MKSKVRLYFLYIILFLTMVFGGYIVHTFLTMPPDTLIDDHDETGDVLEYVETTDDRIIPDITFDEEELLKINPHFQGWLYIPDTPISHPIVLGNDNSYYLNHSFQKNRNSYGCLFFDTRSIKSAQNRVIYGHNMGNQRTEMFSSLIEYQNQDYAEAHKYIYYVESGTTKCYEVFAVVNFNTDYIAEFDYRQPFFETEKDLSSFVSHLSEESIYASSFIPTKDLLILSTCNRAYGSSNRLIICCGEI